MAAQRADRVLALWATPRTVSTAFERMVIERGDHLVLDEPFARAYYFGPDRRSSRYPLSMPESSYPAVLEGVLDQAREAAPVFVKDMAYQAEPGLPDEALDRFTHTFLVRAPGPALTSFAAGWPDFTPDEAGYEAQHRLFLRVTEQTGAPPVVVDSDDLRADPPAVIGAWCTAVGLDPDPAALHWERGLRPEWPLWHDWYSGVADSTGFRPPPQAATEAPDEALAELYEDALPRYREMAENRLTGA